MKTSLILLFLSLTLNVCYAQEASETFTNPNNDSTKLSDNLKDNNDENPMCEKYKDLSPSAEDFPTMEQKKQLKNCDAIALYYGFKGEPDYKKAKLCALNDDINTMVDTDATDDFEKPYVLFMIYAKGLGEIKQNYPLSMHYACEGGGAPAEVDDRLEHLKKLQKKKIVNPDIDICDDITSGFMQGWCANKDAQLASIKRNQRIKEIGNQLPDSKKKYFDDFTKEYFVFCDTHSDNEVDQSGTARGAIVIGEREDCQDKYLDTMDKSFKNNFPHYSQDEFEQLDKNLNDVYQKVLKDIKKNSFNIGGELTTENIQNTERGWLKKQPQWIDVLNNLFPEADKVSIQGFLTQQRTDQLNAIIGDTK